MEDNTTHRPQLEELMESIKDEFEQLAAWMVEQSESDLKSLEDGLRQRGHQLLCKLLQRVLAESCANEPKREFSCRGCGHKAVDLGLRPKRVHLTLGEMQLERRCYWCKGCAKSFAPQDETLGIDQSGRSPGLVEAIALLGSEVAFEPAAQRLAQLCGVKLGPSQVQTVAEGIGRSLEAQQLKAVGLAFDKGQLPQVERTSPVVIVELDGVMVPYRDGYHEVKTAAIGNGSPAFKEEDGLRVEHWSYVAHTADVDSFGRLAWLQSYRQGVEEAKEVVVLADGAAWIWALAQEHWPKAVQVLDFWHATQHLWSMGGALFGEQDEQVAPWVQAAKGRMADGQMSQMLSEWETVSAKVPQLFSQELNYFRNQVGRMNYPQYRERGYPIGSGVVESANRHVVGVRVKQSGMHWLNKGVRGILALRVLMRSGGWTRWWESQSLPIPIAA